MDFGSVTITEHNFHMKTDFKEEILSDEDKDNNLTEDTSHHVKVECNQDEDNSCSSVKGTCHGVRPNFKEEMLSDEDKDNNLTQDTSHHVKLECNQDEDISLRSVKGTCHGVRPNIKEEILSDEELDDCHFIKVESNDVLKQKEDASRSCNGMQLIEGDRGGTFFHLHQGFLYKKKKIIYNMQYFTCTTQRCPATCRETELGSILLGKPHNHQPMKQNDIQKLQMKQELRERAVNDPRSNRFILNNVASRFPGIDMSYQEMESIMTTARRRYKRPSVNTLVELGKALSEFSRYGVLPTNPESEWFRGFECTKDGHTICSFIPDIVLEEPLSVLMIDSSYKMNAQRLQSCHLVTILTLISDHVFPISYFLITGKTQAVYDVILNKLYLHMYDPLEPKIIVTDFEIEVCKAVQNRYPSSRVIGCFFKYAVALFRKGIEEGITEGSYFNVVKQLGQLALLPPEDILPSFHIIKDEAPKSFPVNYFNYYEKFWLGEIGCNMFSVWDSPVRANNFSESHNSTLRRLNCPNPGTWDFIDLLRKLSFQHVIQINKLYKGYYVSHCKKRFCRELDRIILNAQEVYKAEENLPHEEKLRHFLHNTRDLMEGIYNENFPPPLDPCLSSPN